MHAGDEDLADEFFADAPILGETDVLPGFGILPGLQPAGCCQQGKFGAVGVVLQGVTVQSGEALPVAKLPLGAGTFKEVFVVGGEGLLGLGFEYHYRRFGNRGFAAASAGLACRLARADSYVLFSVHV